ncbi:MAG: pentapeptide repeat-containing protein [Acidobacteriota bacterium]
MSTLRFAGKVTLRSTNATGDKRYLTPGQRNGLVFPWMEATQATDRERVILYLAPDGNLRIEMDDQSYLTLIPSLGFVSGTREQSEAQPMRWAAAGSGGEGILKGESGLEIWDPDAAKFKAIRYSVNVLLPYLVVSLDAQDIDAPTLTTFARTEVTPGLEAIQKSKSAPGADLRKVDLTGADLSGVDLTAADFRGAILNGTDLRGATLAQANFEGASFLGTKFQGATLDGARFNGGDLSKAFFDDKVKARETDFSDCVMVGVSMAAPAGTTGADLRGAIFTGAELAFTDLSGAVLRSAQLLRANLTGAILAGVDFTGAQLGGLDQSLAASLPFTYLANAVFSQANLFGVSFAYASLFGASVSINDTSTLEQADFSNAYLAGIDLSGAVLSGSRFDGACLVNTNFVGADLTATLKGSIRTSLANAVLYGAKFQGAKLDGANLSGAAVAFDRGFFPVRYCGANGKPFPSPPDSQPTAHRETTGIDSTTLGPSTICPNGLQWGKRGERSLEQMLTIADPPTEWFPSACRPNQASVARPTRT